MPVSPRSVLRLAVVGLTGLALLAGGCGGGQQAASTTSRPPVATTAPPPGDQQLRSIVVQAGDLAPGWTAKPSNPPSDRATTAAQFAKCMGVANTENDLVAIAYSPNFVNGSVVIASRAASYASREAVKIDTAALLDPKASSCLVEVGKGRLVAGLPKGATVKSDTLKVTAGAGPGPPNVVATATSVVMFVAGGRQFTLNDDIVYLVAPRIEARIDFYNVGKPVDPQVKAAVISKVSQRVTFGS